MKTPREIVELMLAEDAFSKLLGMKVLELDKGKCKLSMIIHDNFVNGFNIAHGALSYALADSALAFAANSYGFKAVSLETSISHTRPCFIGDELIAHCIEENKSRNFAIYSVKVLNQNQKIVALFKGTVSISENTW